jgi:hypothetical protein
LQEPATVDAVVIVVVSDSFRQVSPLECGFEQLLPSPAYDSIPAIFIPGRISGLVGK